MIIFILQVLRKVKYAIHGAITQTNVLKVTVASLDDV